MHHEQNQSIINPWGGGYLSFKGGVRKDSKKGQEVTLISRV